MPACDEILCERLRVTDTLDAGIHKAGVSQVAQASCPLFRRNWKGQNVGNTMVHFAKQDKWEGKNN